MSELGEGALMVAAGIILGAMSILWKGKSNDLSWITARLLMAFAALVLGLIGLYLVSQGLSADSKAMLPPIQNDPQDFITVRIFVFI